MAAEETLRDTVDVMVRIIEACGVAVISFGAIWAFLQLFDVAARDRRVSSFAAVRLRLGRALALGLEFQLASDVLRTAVAPSFREIGQLASIVAIRTAVNYFLSMEIAEERRQVADAAAEHGH
ncbi:DUF1622 domain-containing protein [Streptomyces odontomachi]|uniref:DUF1622 domain-containing protein n=1 Tax=Streptomyces odontomachi TaxID=2944940 RepID=UPI00210CEF52|nr:DUF1622 domain-containing protein [Streptomyces sp. ODS25]